LCGFVLLFVWTSPKLWVWARSECLSLRGVKMKDMNVLLTDSDLIASFSDSKIARRQYEVFFFGANNAHMMVWADNKKEANRIAREYAKRILNRSFDAILVGA
jgi:hypothetical protein